MSLDEEIALYQFAQGVCSEVDLVRHLSQLDEGRKTNQFLDVNRLVRQLKPTDADGQQALADSSLTAADVADTFMKDNRLTFAIHPMMNLRESNYEKAYTFQLYLFKAVYQRHFPLGNPANWRYWDLSNPEVVGNVRTKHQALVEEIYVNPGYRSEFDHIAKLWYEQKMARRAKRQEPASEPQTRFTFLSYDEMMTESIKAFTDKQSHGIRVLCHSLEKALSRRYGIEVDELSRILFEVIERHLRDRYNTDLFSE